MASKLFTLLNRLSSKLQSTSKVWGTPFLNAISSRSMSTKRFPKSTLYSKISPLGAPGTSLIPEIENWVEKGKSIRAVELQRIIRDLRKRRRYTQALEISEWMHEKGICKLLAGDHAVQLDLIGKVRGVDSAESYFDQMSDEYKTDKTYGALLNCYVRARLTEKSLSHMQKMKDIGYGSTPLAYNDLMCLYNSTGEHEKVLDLLNDMKENGITLTNFTYRICMNSYGIRSDIEGVEKLLQEMESQPNILMDSNTYLMVTNFYIKAGLTEKAVDALKKAEVLLDKKDPTLYNHLISLNASLGNKAEMMRFWKLQKDVSKRHINKDYITMLGSLVKIEELEEAEKLLKEWESSGNCYDFRVPNVLLIAYCKRHLVEKAEALLEDLVEKGRNPAPNSWVVVALGYVHKDEMEKALRCIKMAFAMREGEGNENWKPNPKVIYSVLRWLGDKGEVEEVEDFVGLMKTVVPMDREMYHALIKTNIRAGKEVDGLIESMKADNIDEDEETKNILSLREDQQNDL